MKIIIAIVALGMILAGQLSAQTFKTLHTFTGGADGGYPEAKLIGSGTTLFGTTSSGGSTNNSGTIYSVNTDGTGFTVLHAFTGADDGAYPRLAALSGTTLFGTTGSGGSTNNSGTIYSVNTDGTGFTVLHSFTGVDDGAYPEFATLSGNTLYGITASGGPSNGATIFAVNTDGSGFHTVYSFNGADIDLGGSLLISGNTLYGTGSSYFFSNSQIIRKIFALNTDGSEYKAILSVTNGLNGDPLGDLRLYGNKIYEQIDHFANHQDMWSIFSLNTDGSAYQTVYSFPLLLENSNPLSISIIDNNKIYGQIPTAAGIPSSGSIFTMNIDGTGFKRLHSFTSDADGAYPNDVTLLGNNLYGTASYGGAKSNGTVFSISLGASGTHQTISFATPPARTYSTNATFSLSATASSGLSVDYTSSNTNVAVVSSNIVTIFGAGNTTLTASQAGDTNYSAAVSVGRVLKVLQANQTISFGKPASVTYGAVTSFNLSGTNSSGLPVNFASSKTNVATVSGNVVTITGAGNTAITASTATTANYKVALPVHQLLTVAKASQSLIFMTPPTESFVQGNTFTLSAIAMSGSNLPVTFKSSNFHIISISGTTATIHAVGNVTLTASQKGNGNYLPAVSTAVVTVQ